MSLTGVVIMENPDILQFGKKGRVNPLSMMWHCDRQILNPYNIIWNVWDINLLRSAVMMPTTPAILQCFGVTGAKMWPGTGKNGNFYFQYNSSFSQLSISIEQPLREQGIKALF